MNSESLNSSEVVQRTTASELPAPRPASGDWVRSEIQLHVVFFSMAAIVLLMSVLMRTEGDTAVFLPGFQSAMPETCTSRRVLGIDCPGCGLTRAFISISQGKFARAWRLNHASFVVYLFVAIQIPWHSIQIWRLWRNRRPLDWNLVYLIPIGVVVVLTINWVWKLYQTL